MTANMKRREFIALLGGAAAWPLTARAQQTERMRRIGVLMNLAGDDPESPVRVAAFAQGLQELGWIVGRNVRIDTRCVGVNVDRSRSYATELVALAPDVILASGYGMLAMRGIEVGAAVVIVAFGTLLLAGYIVTEQMVGI